MHCHHRQTIINPGSVGLLFAAYGYASDVAVPDHAGFTLITADGSEVRIELRRVPIDRDELSRHVEASQGAARVLVVWASTLTVRLSFYVQVGERDRHYARGQQGCLESDVTVNKPDTPQRANELNIGGVRCLLVGVSSSHLAGLAEDDVPGRHALAEWRTGMEPWAASYDLEALLDPIWNPRTLCGLEWIEMEPGDRPPLDGGRAGVYAYSAILRLPSRSAKVM
ncbi:MAG TPA: hypothetical protein VFD97_03925 [Acidimicrobiia bacterium]|nr:hypothetical protein [Acidimicrobiia bacterium]